MGRARLELVASIQRRLSLTGVLCNGLGATIVVAFASFLLPNTVSDAQLNDLRARTIPAFFAFAVVALPLGWLLIQRRPFRSIQRWLLAGTPADDDVREHVVRYPRNWALWSFAVWVVGAVYETAVNASISNSAALAGAVAIVLGGATSCSLQYLLVERTLRPVTALALSSGLPVHSRIPGVGHRLAMAWTLASGVPFVSVGLVTVLGLTRDDFDSTRVIGSSLFLAAVGLSIGLAAMLFAAQSVTNPLEEFRQAVGRVEAGDLDTRVPIDDASEVGRLQAGFNLMVAGLAERERLRDAFGAFVDPALTERVLREGIDLAGEEVELSLLFMDVRGFTTFSERADARDVVASLNALYEQVVPAVLRHGGHANKFIGDGLLAIFGAPDRLPNHAAAAVAAGLDIVELVRSGQTLRVGVGINSGAVVAGTIGGGGRLDFTVIGDPVNTAARVESATRQTGDDLLITGATLALLGADGRRWEERSGMALKGKREPVRLYAPAFPA